MERRASAKASEEVIQAGGVDTGGTTVVVAAGAEVVVLESLTTGTADDLCTLGTLWKVSVVGLSSLSSLFLGASPQWFVSQRPSHPGHEI